MSECVLLIRLSVKLSVAYYRRREKHIRTFLQEAMFWFWFVFVAVCDYATLLLLKLDYAF